MFQEHITSLFELPKVQKGSSSQLRHLVDSVNAHVSAMLSIGTHENIADALVVYLVSDKLDVESQIKWEESIDYSKLIAWSDCSEILSRRCQNLEIRDSKIHRSSDSHASTNQPTNRRFRPNFRSQTNPNSTSLVVSQNSCVFCNSSSHKIPSCSSFAALSCMARFHETKKLCLLCLNCLEKGHSVRKCSARKCSVCSGPHHLLLHRFSDQLASPSALFQSGNISENAVASSSAYVSSLEFKKTSSSSKPGTTSATGSVILATAIVYLMDRSGGYHPVRALLDSASQLSFITESTVQRLRLRKNPIRYNINGIGGIKPIPINYNTFVVLKSQSTEYRLDIEAFVIPRITSIQPEDSIDVTNWQIPKNIQLADPHFYVPSNVDLLLGADSFFELLSVGQIRLGAGLPTLQKTLLGWIISGKFTTSNAHRSLCNVVVEERLSEADSRLSELVENFWKIENLVCSNQLRMTDDERLCEKIFKENIHQNHEGRFVVKLPFNSNKLQLCDSFSIAQKRFFALERKLLRNSNICELYINFMREYLSLGHMEKVPINEMTSVRYYAPHQCVIRPDSSTTKLRVVFDCSAPTSSQVSLNDVLLKGPVVQDELFSIVLRFRCYKYALTADVCKMYRQILVQPKDCNYQCILWRKNPNEILETYRLLTVTYGTTSAPFLATRCLLYLADEHSSRYPLGSSKVKNDFYMDDLITGADSSEEVKQICEEVSLILKSAKFDLKKWYSNDQQFLASVPLSDRGAPLRINDIDVIKALGVVWEPLLDAFRYIPPDLPDRGRITKRTVLSELSQLFDPLGLINPIIVKAKIFMQDIWILKLHWDETLPINLHTLWENFKKQLQDLRTIEVPRYVLSSSTPKRIELHGFADASLRAYGCCIYIRAVSELGVNVTLFSAKSRVAPIKTKSLPRLELCAAELLVDLLEKVRRNFPKTVDETVLWSDSKTVLDWLSAHPSCWSIFVANRVSKVQEGSTEATWRHVGSTANPADIISRGATVSELKNSFWFIGPPFLYKTKEHWPPLLKSGPKADSPEIRNVTITLVATRSSIDHDFANTYTKFSEFPKACRIFALVVRFFSRLRGKIRKKGSKEFSSREVESVNGIQSNLISPDQLHDALMRIVWNIQQISFAEEIALLDKGQPVNSRHVQNPNPFLHTEGNLKLLRVGGRLQNADLPFECKHPLLLPKKNPFVLSYIRYLHIKNFHAGPQALVALIRQRFWIINARTQALATVKKCIHCFKYRPRLQQQLMGSLPKGRVEMSRPFLISGVDFCGPIMATDRVRGRGPKKVYIAVFVCFATKATHIEVVSDLTSVAFIACLKRFVARRGLCHTLHCDNGTNFVGARRELAELREAFLHQQTQGHIASWAAAEGIRFCHIPPRAPHFGGLWEAAVKSCKYHLVRMTSNALLTYEELSTVVAEIESVLNSWPISAMSSDPSDEEVITPGHFLVGGPLRALAEPMEPEKSMSHVKRWKLLSLIRQHFWNRWSHDYLLALQGRTKWKSSSPDVKEGALVLVGEDNVPSHQWLLGRITKVVKGNDNHIRVVDVQTKKGIIRRPIHRIGPIPLEEN